MTSDSSSNIKPQWDLSRCPPQALSSCLKHQHQLIFRHRDEKTDEFKNWGGCICADEISSRMNSLYLSLFLQQLLCQWGVRSTPLLDVWSWFLIFLLLLVCTSKPAARALPALPHLTHHTAYIAELQSKCFKIYLKFTSFNLHFDFCFFFNFFLKLRPH